MYPEDETHPAPYALTSADCGGRKHPEPPDHLHRPFVVDRHRILESTAFRRLEQKTQVFAPAHHDHFRTRLTHTIEAAHLARCLAVALRANEALTEAITLAHDLGHAPFGHAGEAALNEWMADSGGFNHNAHSLRVVEYLEHPFPAFRGLNLTFATLAGLAAHETRYDVPHRVNDDRLKTGVAAENRNPSGCDNSVEARIASIADRIAYDHHDLEDAIGAGFVNLKLLNDIALWRYACESAIPPPGPENIHAVRRVVLDRMIDAVLADVVESSLDRLRSIASPDQARQSRQTLVAPSPAVETPLAELESFLLQNFYQQPEIVEMDARGRAVVLELCEAYLARPELLPSRFAGRIDHQGAKRVICDYVAGMTDRFAMSQHERINRR